MSLYELQKSELIKTLKQYQSNYRHLIVDDTTYPLVNELLGKDVLNYAYTYNKIDNDKRSTNRDQAIYILDPARPYTIECVMADFSRGKRYESSVVCFLPGLTKAIKSTLRSNQMLMASCGGGFEKIEFLSLKPLANRVYVTGNHYSVPAYYNSQQLGVDLTIDLINRAVQSMLSLCLLTNEYPTVRYFNSPAAKKIAYEFQKQLDEYYRNNPDLSPVYSKTVFFVADRTMDMMSPFAHFKYYSSQIFDLMDKEIISERGQNNYSYQYDVALKSGTETETKQLNFDRNDAIYCELKDLTVPEYTKAILAHYRELQAEDAKMSKLTYVSDIAHAHLTQGEHLDKRQKIVGHYKLIKKIEKTFLEIEDVGDCMAFEGQIASNLGPEKDLFEPVTDALIECLVNPKIEMTNRIRLLIIYAYYRGGIVEADLQKLCLLGLPEKVANVTKLFRNFEKLGLHLLKPTPATKPFKRESYHEIKNTDDLTERYVPSFANVITRLGYNKLPEVFNDNGDNDDDEPFKDFPYVKGAPIEDIDTDYQQPVRNQPRWKSSKSSIVDITRQKMLIFVAGGLTHSEVSIISSLESKVNKNIFLGTDEIYTTLELLGDITMIDEDRKSAEFPMDLRAVKRKVPSFLAEQSGPSAPKLQQQQSQQRLQQQPPLQSQQQQGFNAMPGQLQSQQFQHRPSTHSSSVGSEPKDDKEKRKRDKLKKLFF